MSSAIDRLEAYAQGAAQAGTPIDVGQPLIVFPVECPALDHAAMAWAHATGVPTPPSTMNVGAELVITSVGIAYTTFPVPYVWWRRWADVTCSRAVAGRPRWRAGTKSVYVADRVPPFEGRAFELPTAAVLAFMDYAVQQGAIPPSEQ